MKQEMMGWQRHQQDHVKIIYALLQMNQPNNTIRPILILTILSEY